MGSGSGGEGCEQNKKRKIASDIRKLRNLSSGSEYNDDGEKEMGSEQIRSSFKKEVVAGENTQSTPDHLLKGDLREEASRQIARFFYTSAVPFNCVKNPEFEKMCRLIADYGPGFKPPTFREHFTSEKDLIRPTVTRFATTYFTLGCLFDNKTPLVTMFSSAQWKSNRFASTEDGRKVEQVVLDSRFWENVLVCLKAAAPLIKVLCLIDADDKPTMGFIYEEMDKAKEKIQANFKNVKKSYEPIWKIIDERWETQLLKSLHAAAYYLNPQFHYSPNFKAKFHVKYGLYTCMGRMLAPEDRNKVHLQLEMFKEAQGLFGIDFAKSMRDKKQPAQWWDSYGDQCPELQKFAIRILSLTCISFGCERNWSAFEMVHSKRRNHLHQKKMNDLMFVMYNQKLKDRKAWKLVDLDDISSDDEWITEDDVAREEEEEKDIAFKEQNYEEI
ncbi:zf-BED domain-containing protein/DUF659 domain-containing protein/Dimer_Tnp_hAT domain-containing protein [Senna tora]|uniref:Zf-BED domain-containing protein/DUF659 domain-containing protein/Dimer_Tnp_hAT domain-containing protein n=1 Tax=Senna tora TaxID=362788 RepID=A0A834TN83_9FABA|nr:zf-BED domain-containing protein/DUF659 domain-containing protein/Dimer_Tnp_hAT domain-containing protein [Senna tora]